MSVETLQEARTDLLLGDEAVALGAWDAGVGAAYGYPGTPSTEILETLLGLARGDPGVRASWCANEKTAYEAALGASLAGRRAIVTMKHVGLNVAADPFMNSALVDVQGGLVVAVADDPGMHSSQNEQDSRLFADFARVPCFEPADPQQAYEMTRAAFALSERFHVPALLRLTTRLAHGRSSVLRTEREQPRAGSKRVDPAGWTLLPPNARRRFHRLLEVHDRLAEESDRSPWNRFDRGLLGRGLGVVTTGVARDRFLECAGELVEAPAHLHLGFYPLPLGRLRALAESASRLLVLEEGYPYLEERLRSLLGNGPLVRGRLTGDLPPDGELSPDLVRQALRLPRREGRALPFDLPGRPPQLCQGCPHRDAYAALALALEGREGALVTSDIGCYTLGALPPISIGETCVCMGASIGMARGAAEAGVKPAVAVIGDSTFLHSGVTPLMDAVASSAPITVVVLDNQTVAMTGLQDTVLPGSRLRALAVAVGVPEDHVREVEAHPHKVEAIARVLREEIDHPGPSLVIVRRECPEAVRFRRSGGGA